jgi:hypothetical protein
MSDFNVLYRLLYLDFLDLEAVASDDHPSDHEEDEFNRASYL